MQSFFIKFQKSISYLLLIAFISSCNLYKISENPLTTKPKIDNYIGDHKTTIYKKYIVIHYDGKLYAVENFRMEDELYKGKLITMNSLALAYYEKSLIKKNTTIPSKYKKYGNQLHLHIENLYVTDMKEFQFNSSQIVQIRTLQQNEGAVVASVFGGFLSAVFLFSLGIIALANNVM